VPTFGKNQGKLTALYALFICNSMNCYVQINNDNDAECYTDIN